MLCYLVLTLELTYVINLRPYPLFWMKDMGWSCEESVLYDSFIEGFKIYFYYFLVDLEMCYIS
jgi:hypothetical protein